MKGSKQRTSNYYAENPVRVNSSTRFEEPGYDRLRVDVNQEPMVPIDSEGYAKTIVSLTISIIYYLPIPSFNNYTCQIGYNNETYV